MPNKRSQAELVAEDYYDSSDADKFYEIVWGGEDIHVGLYFEDISVYEASRKTVEVITAQLESISADSAIIDLGAGYGGSARYLAQKYNCSVTCLNLSEVQNARNRELNLAQNLDDNIDVLYGSYESIPADSSSMDIVWSQDAFLHSGNKKQIIKEIARVLKPGGEVIFTDPMQADDCPEGVLQAVYDRLNLESMASIEFYKEAFAEQGFEVVRITEMTTQLRNHYASVKKVLEDQYQELSDSISAAYLNNMILGLDNWVVAADSGYLSWGILHFRKQA